MSVIRLTQLILFSALLLGGVSCHESGELYRDRSDKSDVFGEGKNFTADIVSVGNIDRLGSIFVNGIEFNTDNAEVLIDGVKSSEGDLKPGMVVTVEGVVHSNGTTGIAHSVVFNHDVQGPISALKINSNGTGVVTVLSQDIWIDKASTLFEGVSFDSLSLHDRVTVSGFYNSSSMLKATRIEKKIKLDKSVSFVRLSGMVTKLTEKEFIMGQLTVDLLNADLSIASGEYLIEGAFVDVEGTISESVISAQRIEIKPRPFEQNNDNASLEGVITNYIDSSNFVISGQAVNAANAKLQPSNLIVQEGLLVLVKGKVVDSVMMVNEIVSRHGNIRLAAKVSSLNISSNTSIVTLDFVAGNVPVVIDNKTQLEDKTKTFKSLSLADLKEGDFIGINALKDDKDIIATELYLTAIAGAFIEAPLENSVRSGEVNVLGLRFPTIGASFEGSNEQPVSDRTFYSQLRKGHLIKIEDNQPADGIADLVVFKE